MDRLKVWIITLDGSVNGHVEDTAGTISVVELLDGGDVNVTRVTPRSTPRVLDDESFKNTDLLVTDSEDSVVNRGTATSGDDTGLVELEDRLISLDGNRDGGINQSSLQLVRALGSDSLVARGDLNSLGSSELAGTVLSSVGIVTFLFKTILGSIVNSLVGPATRAARTSSLGAINDLLFREGEELAVVDEIERFEDTGGGESPA
jgi:hypothetical protein